MRMTCLVVLLHGGKVPRSMLQAGDSKYGGHASILSIVSQPCDTVQRRRLALRQDCDFMHTLFSGGFARTSYLWHRNVRRDTVGFIKVCRCCRSTGPYAVMLPGECIVVASKHFV